MISMENEKAGKPMVKCLVKLAEGSFTGKLDSKETLRILDRTKQKYRLSDYSFLNIALIPVGSNKYEYLVYANIPDAPLPLNYQERKGLLNFIGGKMTWPAVAVESFKTNAQRFEALFAPSPKQYSEDLK